MEHESLVNRVEGHLEADPAGLSVAFHLLAEELLLGHCHLSEVSSISERDLLLQEVNLILVNLHLQELDLELVLQVLGVALDHVAMDLSSGLLEGKKLVEDLAKVREIVKVDLILEVGDDVVSAVHKLLERLRLLLLSVPVERSTQVQHVMETVHDLRHDLQVGRFGLVSQGIEKGNNLGE